MINLKINNQNNKNIVYKIFYNKEYKIELIKFISYGY